MTGAVIDFDVQQNISHDMLSYTAFISALPV
jgi:hypothetical protein